MDGDGIGSVEGNILCLTCHHKKEFLALTTNTDDMRFYDTVKGA